MAQKQLLTFQIWLAVREKIDLFQIQHPTLKWAQKLDPWKSVYTSYISHKAEYYLANPLQLCKLVYVCECQVQFKQRLAILKNLIINNEKFSKEVLILGVLRFFELVNYFYNIFLGQQQKSILSSVNIHRAHQQKNYKSIKQFILLKSMKQNTNKILQFKKYCVQVLEFRQSLNIQGTEIMKQQKIIGQKNNGQKEEDQQDNFNQSNKQDQTIKTIKTAKDYCEQFLKFKESKQFKLKFIQYKEAYQFSLIYLLKFNVTPTRQRFRDMINDILNILQKPTPNTKKFQRLDPTSWIQYSEKTQSFFRKIEKIYRQMIDQYRTSSRIRIPQFQQFQMNYLAYDKGKFLLQFGSISFNKSQEDVKLFLIQHYQDFKIQTDEKDYIQIMVPGFINLHTHTKFNFQGNVDFGSRFSYRFQWRQSQYQGKQVIENDKILMKNNKENKKQSKNQFKKYVKYYTQLQALIGGTTTIFEQANYDKNSEFKNIIRKAIIQDSNSQNISSNDIYVIWRNQKRKQNLILVWSQDFIQFLEEVIKIQLEILKRNERNRINLHVHLAQGKSNSSITICQFDNFCYDIIALEHFVKHLKDNFNANIKEKDKIQIKCDSKIIGEKGISIISAQEINKRFKVSMEIQKLMVISKQGEIKMKVNLTIKQFRIPAESSLIKQTIVKKIKQLNENQITQIYKLQSVRGNLLLIHANTFDVKKPLHLYLFEAYQIKICISPFSNMTLYGGIKDFNWNKWIFDQKLKKNLCIGTDWNPTGKQNLIQQIHYLIKKLKQSYLMLDLQIYSNLFEMITINPGIITKMNIGQIQQNYCADFWIGRFPKWLFKDQKNAYEQAKILIKFILTQFNYQNDILKVYKNGNIIYSQTENENLQKIILDNQKNKYFYNPEGVNDLKFQDYIQQIRKIMVKQYNKPISLLFP